MKNLAFAALTVLLLAGLFLYLKPPPASTNVEAAAPSVTAQEPSPHKPEVSAPQVFELVVAKNQLAQGEAVLRTTQGTEIILRVTSDHADELHLHGYDLSLSLPKGQPAELRFMADRSGRFEYELHHAHLELGVLEVQPR